MKSLLKGGIIGLLVGIVYFALMAIALKYGSDPSENVGSSGILQFLGIFLAFPLLPLIKFDGGNTLSSLLPFLYVIAPISFIIGCSIGLFNGSLKSTYWLKYLIILDVFVLVPLVAIIFWLPEFSIWSRSIVLIGAIIVLAITSIVGALIGLAVGKIRKR